jgi:anti-sigma factor RsiW
MTECANVEMRERLPELAHERLSAADAASVEAHVSECSECAAELEVMRAVIASAPQAPAINVAAIVARLPQPGVQVQSAVGPRIARDGRVFRFGMRQLPVAAALALAASLTFVVVRRENATAVIPASAASGPAVSAPVAAPNVESPGPSPSKVVPSVTRNAVAPGLTLGGSTTELSDESLALLVEEIDGMDAVPAAEPESLEPSLGDEEGGQ